MTSEFPERDWKTFKKLRDVALERFSERIRAECIAKFNDATLTAHERYLAVYDLIQDRDTEIARIFDSLRRSTALLQLRQFWRHGLIDEEEAQALSEETRQLAGLNDTTLGKPVELR
jgi:hypothetical protein